MQFFHPVIEIVIINNWFPRCDLSLANGLPLALIPNIATRLAQVVRKFFQKLHWKKEPIDWSNAKHYRNRCNPVEPIAWLRRNTGKRLFKCHVLWWWDIFGNVLSTLKLIVFRWDFGHLLRWLFYYFIIILLIRVDLICALHLLRIWYKFRIHKNN
jgi:hypothetical protein